MTNFLFYFLKKKKNFNYLRFILIHKNLKKILCLYNKNVLILDDAVSLRDFYLKKKIKKKKKKFF